MLMLLILSSGLLVSTQLKAMEGSERALLPAGTAGASASSSKTPEDMLNEAAAQWFEERNSLLTYEKAANCCAKTVGVGCAAAGTGAFGLSAFFLIEANSEKTDVSVRFIPAVFGAGCAAIGTILTGSGVFFLYPRKYFENTLKDLDVEYIQGAHNLLHIKTALNEDELTPEAKELLMLARKNSFAHCEGITELMARNSAVAYAGGFTGLLRMLGWRKKSLWL